MMEPFIHVAHSECLLYSRPQVGPVLQDNYFAFSLSFLPGQSSDQKGDRGRGEGVKRESGAGGCERQTLWVCLGTAPIPAPLSPSQAPPRPLLPSWPEPHLHDPGKCSFSTISLERITKVFSLALLSCDQSIAQEMGSLKNCLSKISYFTRWSVLREHSASSLPRANISVTCVLGARLRPHILCLVKANIALLSEHLCSRSLPHPRPGSEARRQS